MKATTFKKKFKSQLAEFYPGSEVNSLFDWVFEEITGISRINLALNPLSELTAEQERDLELALRRLKKQEPVQYILGKTEFYGLPFRVNEHVLIPRPETEELVDWIVEDIKPKGPTRILDIGTGSGCIAIALAKALKQAKVFAMDVSKKALKIATGNANSNTIAVDFVQEDILRPTNFTNEVDVIVSNPPYVRELEKQQMQGNVLKHEPHLALFVDNDDALIFYRKIIEFAQNHLSPGGIIYFEINEYLKIDLENLFDDFRIPKIQFKEDIYGKVRMVRLQGLI